MKAIYSFEMSKKNLAHITASYPTRSESPFFFFRGTVAQHRPWPPPSWGF